MRQDPHCGTRANDVQNAKSRGVRQAYQKKGGPWPDMDRSPRALDVRTPPAGPARYLISMRFGCASGFLATVTCKTPLVKFASIESGSIDSGSVTVRVTLP